MEEIQSEMGENERESVNKDKEEPAFEDEEGDEERANEGQERDEKEEKVDEEGDKESSDVSKEEDLLDNVSVYSSTSRPLKVAFTG